ncbi:unnamed protein product, partial [Amoebophrya sp. A120]
IWGAPHRKGSGCPRSRRLLRPRRTKREEKAWRASLRPLLLLALRRQPLLACRPKRRRPRPPPRPGRSP